MSTELAGVNKEADQFLCFKNEKGLGLGESEGEEKRWGKEEKES